MRHTWIIVLGFTLSCYQIDLSSGKFGCDRDSDCPDGLSCRATPDGPRCVDPATAPSPDLAMPVPEPDPDLSVEIVNLATPSDLRTPNDLTPPPPVSPCLGEGRMLATNVWACRGGFALGAAGTLCRDTGYHVCEAADPLAAFAGCNDVLGFYASSVPIERVAEQGTTTYQIDCEIGGNVDLPWGLIGCGKQEGIRSTQVASGTCPPLPQVMRCERTNAWTCSIVPATRGTLAAMSHSLADTLGGGVLCCKNR